MPAGPIGVNTDLLDRVRGEFLEMPGLRLTYRQAKRLWGIEDAVCSAVLDALLDAQFLFRTRDGAFMRVERVPARADLRPAVKRPAVA